MAVDPYINVNQAVVRGGDVDVDGTTSVGGKAKKVQGRLTAVGSEGSSSEPVQAKVAVAPPSVKAEVPKVASESEMPKQADSKDDWVTYAESKGLSRDKAESLTKAELVEKYNK